MNGYRATDQELEREIVAVRAMVEIRLRRATADLSELASVLTDLQRELRRRRAPVRGETTAAMPDPISV